ncbi:MAG: DUF2550 family protein [Kineosporiaceae bacterium]
MTASLVPDPAALFVVPSTAWTIDVVIEAPVAVRASAVGDQAARVVGLVAAVVVLAALLLVVVLVRRWALVAAAGAFECQVRSGSQGSAWRAGVARYDAAQLSIFPLLSLSWWPALVLTRHRLSVVDRRRGSDGAGPGDLRPVAGTTVLRCRYEGRVIEIAMDDRVAGGFAVWVESGPPGRGINVA